MTKLIKMLTIKHLSLTKIQTFDRLKLDQNKKRKDVTKTNKNEDDSMI